MKPQKAVMDQISEKVSEQDEKLEQESVNRIDQLDMSTK